MHILSVMHKTHTHTTIETPASQAKINSPIWARQREGRWYLLHWVGRVVNATRCCCYYRNSQSLTLLAWARFITNAGYSVLLGICAFCMGIRSVRLIDRLNLIYLFAYSIHRPGTIVRFFTPDTWSSQTIFIYFIQSPLKKITKCRTIGMMQLCLCVFFLRTRVFKCQDFCSAICFIYLE